MSQPSKILKNKNTYVIIILSLLALLLPYLMVSISVYVGHFVLLSLFALPIFLLTLKDYRYTIFTLFFYGSTLFLIDRLVKPQIPFGILFDALIVIAFVMMLIQQKGKDKFQWKTEAPITIITLLYFAYFALEIANPEGSIKGWLNSVRFYTLLLLFYIFIHYFSDKDKVKYFLNTWMAVLFVVAGYGLFQEYFGLRDFEWSWIYEVPTRYDLYFIWGKMRKFSILSDPSAYGLFMAFGCLGTMMLAFGPYVLWKRALFAVFTVFCMLAMSYAGTRTAYAMVGAGGGLFILLNMGNPKVLGGSISIVVILLILIFGPFYSAPVQRLRSTFNPSEDASMGVRDIKRIRFQPYIQSHPLGGGINTAGANGLKYAPGHRLAGNFDPDSGYLRTGMEMGWLGLFLFLLLNGTIVVTGVQNHFKLKDAMLRNYNLAFVIPFFGLSVAHFTQDAMLQKPVNLLVIGCYALMIKLRDIDKEQTEAEALQNN